MASQTRWSEDVRPAAERGARSPLTVAVPLQQALVAAPNTCSTRPRAADIIGQELAGTSASYAGVALADVHLADSARQLEQALAPRAVIEQADGVPAGLPWCTAPEALDLLVDLLQRSDRRLRDVPRQLVDTTAEEAAVAAAGQP